MSHKPQPPEEPEERLLIRGGDPIACEMLQELLLNNGIPSRVYERGAGNYLSIYMGYSYIGQALLVRAADYDQARELAEAFASQLDLEDSTDPPHSPEIMEPSDQEKPTDQAEQPEQTKRPLFFTPGKALFSALLLLLLLLIFFFF